MTRILLLDTGHEWGGGTNSMLELLKRLDQNRFQVTACFYRNYFKGDSTLEHELAGIGVPLQVLPMPRQPLWAKLAKELLRALLFFAPALRSRAVFAVEMAWRIRPRARMLAERLREGRFDLLYMNNQPASNLEGYLAAEQSGVAAIQHCRIEPRLNAVERDAVNRIARRVICVSQGVADVLVEQGVRADLCRVVHNAIDGTQPLPPPMILPHTGRPVIGSIGSLIKRKSYDQMLRSAALLKHDLQLLIVGEGPEQAALSVLARRLGMDERVSFAGFQKHPLPWLAAMDIFVLPSTKEGLPRVILEAMLLGKPVVASDVVGSRELVVHGETGLLYPYGDEAALASYLQALLDDPALARRMGEAGRQRVLREFDIEHYVTAVSNILEST